MYNTGRDNLGNFNQHLTNDALKDLTQAERTLVTKGIKFRMSTSKMYIQTQMFIAGLR